MLGVVCMKVSKRLHERKEFRRENRTRLVLEKAVRWIFERQPLKKETQDALLLEAVACGCRLDDLLERSLVLFVSEHQYPPGEPFVRFGMKIGYLWPYFAKKRQLLLEDRKVADCLYRFKQGEYIPGLTEELCGLFERMGLNDGGYVLLCLPASNCERTEKRYRRFSRELSQRMGWVDGYGSLMPVGHEPSHLTGRRVCLDESEYVLDKQILKGKKIVLLDDLLTTGVTLLSVRRLLVNAGLHPVSAVFICRTLEPASI